jgi:hypothetical protein
MVRRTLLFIEEEAVRSVWISFERDGAVVKVGQEGRRDSKVIVDHVAFRESG